MRQFYGPNYVHEDVIDLDDHMGICWELDSYFRELSGWVLVENLDRSLADFMYGN